MCATVPLSQTPGVAPGVDRSQTSKVELEAGPGIDSHRKRPEGLLRQTEEEARVSRIFESERRARGPGRRGDVSGG